MIGIGGNTQTQALDMLFDMTADIKPIAIAEYQERLKKARRLMKEHNIDALYLNAGTNLYYFTGTKWSPSERMVAAIVPLHGDIIYICPHFEVDTLKQFMQVNGDVVAWHEHECPYQLAAKTLDKITPTLSTLAIDESTPFFVANGLNMQLAGVALVDAKPITAGCRMQKSVNEIALMQRAKDMTLAVHKATASILYEGISTDEVKSFIHQAHKKVGAKSGSSFCIVLFGEDSSYPHGVMSPKNLSLNDMVLIDTGCLVEGYNSDITRTYIFGQATERQQKMWQIEKEAQLIAFNAAELGQPCGNVDKAARQFLADQGLGPAYQTPGCPHRTGHGIGLDIHEWPYLVQSDQTPLAVGMSFSNEPMLVIPNEFGVRLEDHFYMTEQGPKWFTEPAHSIDNPFGLEK
ncbi:M24 family metallopeptidase [Colwellia sp. MEBiC06753]